MRLLRLILISATLSAQSGFFAGASNGAPPALGWTHFYPLTDSFRSTVVRDIYGGLNGMMGTPAPVQTWGGGLDFDGSTSMTFTSASSNITTAFSVVFGFSPTDSSTGAEFIIGNNGAGAPGWAVGYSVTNDRHVQMYTQSSGWVSCASGLSDLGVYRYELVVSGTTLTCYKDGEADGTATVQIPNSNATDMVYGYKLKGQLYYLGTARNWTSGEVSRFDTWAVPLVNRRRSMPSSAQQLTVQFPPSLTTVPCTGGCSSPWMGWESWTPYTTTVTPAQAKTQCDLLNSLGLAAVGYTGCMINAIGLNAAARDISGWQLARSFPPVSGVNGIKSLADYLHSVGLKLGWYTSPMARDCTNGLGSYGHETHDMAAMVAMGVDYVMVDWCYPLNSREYDSIIATYGNNAAAQMYQTFAQGINATGHQLAVAISYYNTDSYTWGPNTGLSIIKGHLDTNNTWAYISGTQIPAAVGVSASITPPNRWYDPDNVSVGIGSLTDAEGRTNLGWMSLLAAPLIIGADLTTISANSLTTLKNADVIAVDQDPAGYMGFRVSSVGCGGATCQVWAKQLTGSDKWAIGFFNLDGSAHDIAATWSTLHGVNAAFTNRTYTTTKELWSGSNPGTMTSGYTATSVPAHDCVIIRIAP